MKFKLRHEPHKFSQSKQIECGGGIDLDCFDGDRLVGSITLDFRPETKPTAKSQALRMQERIEQMELVPPPLSEIEAVIAHLYKKK